MAALVTSESPRREVVSPKCYQKVKCLTIYCKAVLRHDHSTIVGWLPLVLGGLWMVTVISPRLPCDLKKDDAGLLMWNSN